MNIGLLFGTFDPVHVGHIKIAISIQDLFDQIWFVVSPSSPFKNKALLSSKEHRINMVNRALKGYDNFIASDIEFDLPTPSYTCNTLRHIETMYPASYRFSIVLGFDNYESLSAGQWKKSKYLLNYFQILIYKREYQKTISNSDQIRSDNINLPSNHHLIDGQLLSISSSFIRKKITMMNQIKTEIDREKDEQIIEQKLRLIGKIKEFLISNMDEKVWSYISKNQLYIN